MNRHPIYENDFEAEMRQRPPSPVWLLLILALVSLAMMFFTSCRSTGGGAPHASTAAVGVDLDGLGQSLGKARGSVDGVRSDLSAVDAKAVRIQEALRKW
jgi:hypothetical protein